MKVPKLLAPLFQFLSSKPADAPQTPHPAEGFQLVKPTLPGTSPQVAALHRPPNQYSDMTTLLRTDETTVLRVTFPQEDPFSEELRDFSLRPETLDDGSVNWTLEGEFEGLDIEVVRNSQRLSLGKAMGIITHDDLIYFKRKKGFSKQAIIVNAIDPKKLPIHYVSLLPGEHCVIGREFLDRDNTNLPPSLLTLYQDFEGKIHIFEGYFDDNPTFHRHPIDVHGLEGVEHFHRWTSASSEIVFTVGTNTYRLSIGGSGGYRGGSIPVHKIVGLPPMREVTKFDIPVAIGLGKTYTLSTSDPHGQLAHAKMEVISYRLGTEDDNHFLMVTIRPTGLREDTVSISLPPVIELKIPLKLSTLHFFHFPVSGEDEGNGEPMLILNPQILVNGFYLSGYRPAKA